jgi:hypothetical protein
LLSLILTHRLLLLLLLLLLLKLRKRIPSVADLLGGQATESLSLLVPTDIQHHLHERSVLILVLIVERLLLARRTLMASLLHRIR